MTVRRIRPCEVRAAAGLTREQVADDVQCLVSTVAVYEDDVPRQLVAVLTPQTRDRLDVYYAGLRSRVEAAEREAHPLMVIDTTTPNPAGLEMALAQALRERDALRVAAIEHIATLPRCVQRDRMATVRVIALCWCDRHAPPKATRIDHADTATTLARLAGGDEL